MKADLLSEHFGTLVIGMVLALFGAFISLAGVALLTWSQTTMNTENIQENREDHESAGADRFTRRDAERLDDRLSQNIMDLVKDVTFLKGQHAGH